MAFGSYGSPPEYHMRYPLRSASYSTCGHMTATFSHGCSAVSTGFSPARSQVLPSALVAYPIEDLPSAWPVYHMWYWSPSRTSTGRLTSSSQPDALRGGRGRFSANLLRPHRPAHASVGVADRRAHNPPGVGGMETRLCYPMTCISNRF